MRSIGTLLTTVVVVLGVAPAAPAADPAATVTVRVDRVRVSTSLGEKFGFRSTITNRGATPARDLVAHLNVLSLRPGTYVDPEDWSSRRTEYLPTIPPGRSTTVSWRVQAVNHGTFGIYVAVLDATGGAPATGQTIRLAVAERKTLNSGGIVPLAVGVPGLLACLAIAVRLRRRG